MQNTTQAPPLAKADLKQYFLQGIKLPTDLEVGVEWEKIGVYRETGEAIRYSGPRGVEAILKAMVRRFGWSPVSSDGHIIALKKNSSSITLEPGGQIELSGHKARTLDENAAELSEHLSQIREVSEPLGIVWLGLGLQPVSRWDSMEWVPKKRYLIMREALKNSGSLTYAMMKETASVQVSLDYTSERDAVEKLRLAMGLSPVLTALFANSPLSEGKPNGFYSRRAYVWLNTAPERTGVLKKAFEPGFTLDDYVDYALRVPMLFLVRGEQWIPARGTRFETFLKEGFEGLSAQWEDWSLHLSTLFTEARLKQYVEIRCMDCQKSPLGLAAAALLKGIFYHEASRQKAWELLADWSWQERQALARQVPIKALRTPLRGRPLVEWAKELLDLGFEGLEPSGETRFLKPLEELLDRKMTPAELFLECLGRSGSVTECAAL